MGEPPLRGHLTAALVPLQAQPLQVEEPVLQAQLSPIGELELPPLQALPLPNEYFDDPVSMFLNGILLKVCHKCL